MTVKERKRDLSKAFQSPSKLKSKENLSDDMFFDYTGGGDQGELANPRPKEPLDEQRSRDFLKFVAEKFEAEAVRSGAKSLAAQHPELLKQFEAQAQPDVPMWADRKKLGITKTVPEWLRAYYGNRSIGGSWEPCGLKRSMLREIDFGLYQAYTEFKRSLGKKGMSVPTDIQKLEETPSQRVERELEEHGITSPEDAYKALQGKPHDADRLQKAAKKRAPT